MANHAQQRLTGPQLTINAIIRAAAVGVYPVTDTNWNNWNLFASWRQRYYYVYSHYGTFRSTIDPDAQAFLIAAGIPDDGTIYFPATAYQITGFAIWTAVSAHVLELKGEGVINTTVDFWSRYNCIYPYIGGSAASHKFNLKDPANTDAAFRLIFSGGITHSGAGIQGNGTTGYANTKFVPSAHLTIDDASCAQYINTQLNTVTNYEMGIYWALQSFFIRRGVGALDSGVNDFGNATPTYSGNRFVSISRSNAANFNKYENGVADQLIVKADSIIPPVEFYLLAMNNTGAAGQFSPRRSCWHAIGASITGAEFAILDLVVNSLQTALFRNV